MAKDVKRVTRFHPKMGPIPAPPPASPLRLNKMSLNPFNDRERVATIERTRRAKIEAAFMDPRQMSVFQTFYALGNERTLDKLAEVCKTQAPNVSIHMLRRWSAQFKWAGLVLQTDVQVSAAISERSFPNHVERVEKALKYLAALEDTFYNKVDRGEVDVSLMEFITVLKISSMLRGLPTEVGETVHAHRFEIDLSDDELRAALRLDVLKKRALPLPRSVNAVDVRVEEEL